MQEPLFGFTRPSLAFYRPSILIEETVEDVEKLLLENRIKESGMAKENLPFVCIVNPPRHGKSLFLDSIFKGRSEVRVIPMVSNNNSNLTDDEMHSPRHALFSFWLRFIGSKLTFLQQSPSDASHPIKEAETERSREIFSRLGKEYYSSKVQSQSIC